MTSLNKKIVSPLAWVIAKTVSHNSRLLNFYRKFDFKGKLLTTEFINIPLQNGVYECQGLEYDIDFDDKIQEMIYFGTYERQELKFLRSYIQRGWVCLDVGANIGFYTLNLSKLVGETGKVYAIEPSPGNFNKLEENISINNLSNCVTSNIALSSTIGDCIFSVSPSQNSGWGRLGKWQSAQSEVLVNVSTLDQFVQDKSISKIDFLKIDIEGHELEFLKGAKHSLENGIVSRILIEYCGYILEQKGITLKHYIDQISRFGYTPTFFNVEKIKEANRGTYQCKQEILNLLFEKSSL